MRDPTVIVAIVAFLSSIGGIILTNRYAARAARIARETAQRELAAKVDSAAFERARQNYEAANAEQEQRIIRLRRELEADRDEFRQDSERCKNEIKALRHDLTALREWSRPLLRAARAAGVVHPDPPIWLGGDTDPGHGGRRS